MSGCICGERKKMAPHKPGCPAKTPPGALRKHSYRMAHNPAYAAKQNARAKNRCFPHTDEFAAQIRRVGALGPEYELAAADILARIDWALAPQPLEVATETLERVQELEDAAPRPVPRLRAARRRKKVQP